MEELIEIIINLIAGVIKRSMTKPGQPVRTPVRQAAPPPPPAVKKPAQRRAGRKPMMQSVAVAQPIITAATARVATASTGTAHAVPAKSIAASLPNVKPSASAASLSKWLTPTTLRQQFMLTEILRPPLAMRRNDER
jgi:hypothetical protein